MEKEFTPENIQELKDNEIFVFGSNMNGNHAGGAAKLAVEKFGAVMGQAEGIQGQSYAIPTLDKDMNKVSMDDLVISLGNFREYAKNNPDKKFYLTKIGCGIAGFDTNDMAYQVIRAKLPDNVILPVEFTELNGYKGFDSKMECRGFKYEVGNDYEEDGNVETCKKGFHFCTNPFDVFGYYPPSNDNGQNRYCAVGGKGNISVDTDDSKVAVSKIHISAEIGLKGIIEAGVKFILDKVNWKDKNTNTGNYSASTNTGNYSASTNTGYRSAATNTGNYSASTNTGNYSASTNTGDRSAATNTGNYSASTNTGYRSAASVEGKESIAIVTGKESKAKGALGCWIVLTERDEWNGDTYPIKDVKAFKVDGEIIKADTYYKLVDGEPVEMID